jgi:hypothetical protein
MQAVASLQENALRHTPAGTQISLRLFADQGAETCLMVKDDRSRRGRS